MRWAAFPRSSSSTARESFALPSPAGTRETSSVSRPSSTVSSPRNSLKLSDTISHIPIGMMPPPPAPPVTSRYAGPKLATYAALILFFELALIRYTAGYVHVFSFYLNFVLIATFLGMGVGLLRAEQVRVLKWIAVPAMVLLFVTIALFANVRIAVPSDPNEFLWAIIADMGRHSIPLPIVATSLFALCAIFFIPLGALFGAEF